MKDAIGRAKGLGSAHEGTHHWWMQRVSAVALIPLTFWMILSLRATLGQEREVAVTWFGHPVTALALVAVVVIATYHTLLGLQVILEDYVHTDWVRVVSLWGVRFIFFMLMGMALFSVIIMVFQRFMHVN